MRSSSRNYYNNQHHVINYGLNNHSPYKKEALSDKSQRFISTNRLSHSRRKRKPIFDKAPNVWSPNRFAFNIVNYFEQQEINPQKVMINDFCGCQNQTTPCSIIQTTFLKSIRLSDMKYQYNLVLQSQVESRNINHKNLFAILPSYYPELYYSHLNSLISHLELKINQFLCLAWIQYHCKLEYITYFLFSDLKKSFNNYSRFIEQFDIALIRHHKTYDNIITQYLHLNVKLQEFLHSYYQSVGAIMIPLTQYSHFISLLMKKGPHILIRMLILFFIHKKNQTFKMLKYINHGQIQKCRNMMRGLNWQSFYQELDNFN